MGRLALKPSDTLLLLLAISAAILCGGLRLARQEEIIRVPRDRAALHRSADALQGEIQRLASLYETHLRRLAREAKREDLFAVRNACDRLFGVRQFSLIYAPMRVEENRHVPVRSDSGESLPVPVIEGSISPHVSAAIALPPDLLSGGLADSGWVDEPGKPLFFWFCRPSGELAVLLIDPKEAGAAMNRWIAGWAERSWNGKGENLDADELLGPDGTRVAGRKPTAQGGDAADLILPIRTRFGVWRLASWDGRFERSRHHTPTVAASVCLSVMAALTGMIVSAQQRRALLRAEQRVSFVNRVSHELRTPLTNILLNLDAAHEMIDDEGPSGASACLATAREEAHRLGRLIANVLTFSQHERGQARPQPRPCSPAVVVESVLAQFSASFARRGLAPKVRNDASDMRLFDADALAQILGNLLSNAEKYASGGEVEIVSRMEGDRLVLEVADDGPGIPPVEAERIFLPFERLSNSIREGASGTGLGLAIARELAVGMGGTLRLAPAARGARFELRAPAPPAPSPAAAIA